MSESRVFLWSVRRELWENRFLYIAPLVVTAFVLLGSLVSVFGLPRRIESVSMLPSPRQQAVAVMPLMMAPAPIMLTTLIIAFFYGLDALHGERRDRSILFWKSLPVSDRTTVLSKVLVMMAVLPAIALLLSWAIQFVLFMVGTVVLQASGVGAMKLWRAFEFIETPLTMIYGLFAHVLWFAPIYGWLLLISAWVKRAPFLWAILPPLAIAAVEKMAFNSTYFLLLVQYRFIGAMKAGFTPHTGNNPDMDPTPLEFITTPGLWIGLMFAAAFIAAAVRLRRNREPI